MAATTRSRIRRPLRAVGPVAACVLLVPLVAATPAAAAESPDHPGTERVTEVLGGPGAPESTYIRDAAPDPSRTGTMALPPMSTAPYSVRVSGGVPVPVRVAAPGQTVMGWLTVTGPVASGYTQVYPCDQGRPASSASNYPVLGQVANFAVVKADAQGYICLASSASAHLIWDQSVASSAVAAHAPVRTLDTVRDGGGIVAAGGERRIVVGQPGQTVFGNLTVTGAKQRGFTTVYPCADGRPETSVNNYVAGQTVANAAAVRADANGEACFYSSGTAHLIWDQSMESSSLAAANALRRFDSRDDSAIPLAAGGVARIDTGAPGATVMGNLTVTGAQANGYTTLYPCDVARPTASVSNYRAMVTTPTFAAVRASASGEVCAYSSAAAHLVWDQVIATTAVSADTPKRLFSSPPRRDSTEHSFLSDRWGPQARWNPCANELPLFVNWGTSAAEQANLAPALERIRQETGIAITYKGTTTAVPSDANSQARSLAPVPGSIVMAFTDDAGTDMLEGALGVGGFHNSSLTGRIDHGFLVINQPELKYLDGPGRVTLYMHELAHVLGMGHAENDPSQVMYFLLSDLNASSYWGNGDISGLRKIGRGAGCKL